MLSLVRGIGRIVALTEKTHDRGAAIAAHYGFSLYDALILAAALLAGCTTVYSENLPDGQRIKDRLTVRNPFGTGSQGR